MAGRQREQRIKGFSLVWHLLLAAALPLAVLFVVVGRDVASSISERRAASGLSYRIQGLSALARVYLPEALERTAMVGFGRIDELGAERRVAQAYTGLDFERISKDNRMALDKGLDALQTVTEHLSLGPGGQLARELAAARARVVELRGKLDRRQATSAELIAAFDRLETVLGSIGVELDRVGSAERLPAGGDPALDRIAGAVQLTLNVARTATDEAHVAFDSIVRLTLREPAELQRAADRHLQALDTFVAMLGQDAAGDVAALMQTKELAGWQAAVQRAVEQLPSDGIDDPTRFNPKIVSMAASLVNAHLDYFYVLDGTVERILQRQLAATSAAARESRDNAMLSLGLLGSTLAITVIGALLLRRWVLRPLRRLSRAASSISSGELPSRSLTESGPTEVRNTTRAFNDLVGSFASIDGAVTSLAAGEVDRQAVFESVPGKLGEGLRASLQRMNEVTDRWQRSDQLASSIIRTADDAIWTVDADGVILGANPAAERLLGYPAAAQRGRALDQVLVVTADPADPAGEQTMAITATGAGVPVLVSANRTLIGDTGVSAVFARDITLRRKLELELAHQALHDSMTGLPNRTAAMERLAGLLEGAVPQAGRAAVLFLDLDGFKAVNDTHGHAAGDRVLCKVARRLELLTEGPTMVARLGGDEFLVIVSGPTDDAALHCLGRRIIAELERPIVTDDATFSLSASVGVAISEPTEGDPLQLIRRADEAAHIAKARGRARVEVYDAAMQAMIEQQSATALALRSAVRDEELELYLQPMVDLATGAHTGAEALVRWRRDGRLIPAGEFIDIAERNTVINDIGRWVLGQACAVLGRWAADPLLADRRISINVSGRHLMDDGFIDDLDAALAATHAEPRLIELELTETYLLTDLERANRVLRMVGARGIHVAVDDFGAGYASMTYLRELYADVVKLDRQFIRHLATDPADQAIVLALLSLGNALGFEVVAEGVEDGAQLDFLTRHGCHRAQGFYVAPPMPISECERWLAVRAHHPVP